MNVRKWFEITCKYEIFFVSLSQNLEIATIESKNRSNQHENISF